MAENWQVVSKALSATEVRLLEKPPEKKAMAAGS